VPEEKSIRRMIGSTTEFIWIARPLTRVLEYQIKVNSILKDALELFKMTLRNNLFK
jgi:hypothetical protein